MLDNELFGLWGADPGYYRGSPGHDGLIFKPDGTGRYEFINWMLCSVDVFRWETIRPGVILIRGEQYLQIAEDLKSLEETPSRFGEQEFQYEITEENMPPSGESFRVLRLPLEFPMKNCFGFERSDLTGLDHPQFSLE